MNLDCSARMKQQQELLNVKENCNNNYYHNSPLEVKEIGN